MPKGTVKWFDTQKNYGFILADEKREELFVHGTNVEKLEGYLDKGERVEFEVSQGRNGREAIHVKNLPPPTKQEYRAR